MLSTKAHFLQVKRRIATKDFVFSDLFHHVRGLYFCVYIFFLALEWSPVKPSESKTHSFVWQNLLL